jgi:hypothetical protein
MKHYLLRAFLVIFLFGTSVTAHAGFRVKKNTVLIESAFAANDITNAAIVKQKQSEEKQEGENQNQRQKRKPSESGWEGIAALVCAVAGIGILGIIFGALGMGKGHKHRGMAIAGFVIGLVQVFFIALIITILAISYA